MELEFEPIDKKHIKVIAVQDGERRDVGEIFTPSGSAETIKNAIQVCGFTEAFDLWGCSRYAKHGDKKKVVGRLTGEKLPYIQVKDIQLMFDWDVEPHSTEHGHIGSDCLGCYNSPCTCDNSLGTLTHEEIIEGKGKQNKNPYNLKREQELQLEEVMKDEPK